jgi:hypothetical protein
MLAHIIDTWPSAWHAWSQRLRSYVAEKFDIDRYVENYLALFDAESVAALAADTKPETVAKLDGFAATLPPGRYALDALYPKIRRMMNLGTQSMSSRRAIRELAQRGAQLDASKDGIIVIWNGAS